MINENILGKCLRCRSSRGGPRISPLSPRYECPRPSLLTITSGLHRGRAGARAPLKTSKIRPRSFSIIPCCIIQATSACFEHPVLFKVNWVGDPGHPVKGTPDCLRTAGGSRRPRPTVSHRTAPRQIRPMVKENRVSLPHSPEENAGEMTTAAAPPPTPPPVVASDYELFNRNNFNIRYWSWSYRGCWHQTCPPMVPR